MQKTHSPQFLGRLNEIFFTVSTFELLTLLLIYGHVLLMLTVSQHYDWTVKNLVSVN